MEYTQHLNIILQYAEQEAQRLGNSQVLPEHLLLGILRLGKGKAYQLLLQAGAEPAIIKQEIDQQCTTSQSVSSVSLSRTVQRMLRLTRIEADLYNAIPGSIHLLLAILRERINMPAMLLEHRYQITYESMEELYPKPLCPEKDEDQDIASSSSGSVSAEDNTMEEQPGIPFDIKELKEQLGKMFPNAIQFAFSMPASEAQPKSKKGPSTLERLTRDLTQEAKEGKLDPIVGRKEEIERVVQILNRRKKNNPVLIGEPGVGKSAIVEGLASMIAKRAIPSLNGKRILSLNMSSLVAGTMYRGQFEQRIQNLLNELSLHPEVIIFIDEIHTIIGAGGAEGALDAANILKPALARGEIQCIGATTIDEYRKSIEKDGALERRFQQVVIQPSSIEDTLKIVQHLVPYYEEHHHVTYTKVAIKACVELSERYLADRAMPDSAIDVLDEAGARCRYKIGQTVLNDDIAAVVSKMTGIPVQRIAAYETEQLLHMDEVLKEKVIGQDSAIDKVVHAIRRSRLGVSDPNRPIGTFFFLGSTGVGKTYLAQAIAEQLFGKKEAIIRFDMSEYTEKHTISLLVGAPPGYEAHQDGGRLTEAVRRHPYSVLLFDEIEKAHPDIFNLLLQLLDEGRLTDRQGRQVDFRHTLIILTSNVGTRRLIDFGAGVGFSAEEVTAQMADQILSKELKKTFPPEFVNRIDDIICFQPLSKETIARILDIEIKKLQKRVLATGHRLNVTKSARAELLEKVYDPLNGARPIKRAIRTYLEDPVTESILQDPIKEYIHISTIQTEKK